MIKFDGENLVSGAGIGRGKDNLLSNLCKHLHVNVRPYKSNFDRNFEHVDVLGMVKHLKTFVNKFDRSKVTFQQFGKKVLGHDLYKLFVQSVSFSDYEDADIVDTAGYNVIN